MKLRIALLIALSGAAIAAASSPASAQSYGGISLSFGSGPAYDNYEYNSGQYSDYDYSGNYNSRYYPTYRYSYNQPDSSWYDYNYDYYRNQQRRQRNLERWNREQQREYARHERDEHRDWHQGRDRYEHGDDDGD